MHNFDIICVVDMFVPPSPPPWDFVIISKCIIIDGSHAHIFTSNVPCKFGVFKQPLPNYLLCFFNIPPSVLECKVIPFDPNGPQRNASQ